MTEPAEMIERLAGLSADGPDEMGRELAGGPDAVAATLAELAAVLPDLRSRLSAGPRTVLVGTGASLAMARAVAPLWRARAAGSARSAGSAGSAGSALIVRESSAVVFDASDGVAFTADDVAIVISKSGASPETVAAAAVACAVGARLVAITAERDSALAAAADDIVWTPIGDEQGAATKSELTALAALMALGGVVEASDAGRVATQLRAVVDDWAWAAERGSVLAGAEHLWILGFGAAEGVATAGALMWHEKVHRPAVATTPSEFRHGPIESATDRDAVILVERFAAPEPERRYFDLLAAEVGQLGTALIRVAPRAAWEAERTLAALLRLQQLARATAHAAGTYRDGFRVLREIVKAAAL